MWCSRQAAPKVRDLPEVRLCSTDQGDRDLAVWACSTLRAAPASQLGLGALVSWLVELGRACGSAREAAASWSAPAALV